MLPGFDQSHRPIPLLPRPIAGARSGLILLLGRQGSSLGFAAPTSKIGDVEEVIQVCARSCLAVAGENSVPAFAPETVPKEKNPCALGLGTPGGV